MNWRGDGMRSWIIQRVSAIFIAFFVIYLGIFLASNLPMSFTTWHSWVEATANKVIVILFFIAIFFHAWVGIRDVVIDYVHPVAIRFVLLTSILGGLVAMSVWLLLIIQGV
jgi:succinate dehydrogenase / fumarate reductase membrane anchor subunit